MKAAAVLLLGLLTALAFSGIATAEDRTFVIEMKNVDFDLKQITVDEGDTVTIVVYNNDSAAIGDHDFAIDGYVSEVNFPPGHNQSFTFTADTAGSFEYLCAVTGHGAMRGTLTVRAESTDTDTPGAEVFLLVLAVVGLVGAVRLVRGRRTE